MVRAPIRYGDIDDSQEVHDEIREVGTKIQQRIADNRMPRNESDMLRNLREHGPAPGGKKLMDNEMAAALWSIESGIYVTFQSSNGNDCCRIGPATKCFCGHSLDSHGSDPLRSTGCKQCKKCRYFNYIPTRPEEVGMGHLPRRKNFNINEWSPGCRCQHGAAHHRTGRCTKCGCCSYQSDWLCVACDKHYEDHTTVVETEDDRRRCGKPVGEQYKPLATVDPQFANLVFRGGSMTDHQKAIKRPSQRVAPSSGSSAISRPSQRLISSSSSSASASSSMPQRSTTCKSCSTPFTTPTAKFCSECGTRRV
eukprot:TRINITY_DN22632_c0_g1_i1.p1 TRINITY_DN22632_c0_g1~~TRINITY_DN22632_c0_g1_i1.p1  ORF type:complete len:324 (+),score=46.89 TRINITY_DN22632_c0_g1_i1:46-972(+)